MLWRVVVSCVALAALVQVGHSEIRLGYAASVRDGDDFVHCSETDCVRIRLCGIDAPERNNQGRGRSKEGLEGILGNKEIRCVVVDSGTPCDGLSRRIISSKRGKSERTVAQCFVGDLDVAVEMVCRGYASDWPRYSNRHYDPKHCLTRPPVDR